MTLRTKSGVAYDFQSPVLHTYGITFLCSGHWESKTWDEIDEIVSDDGRVLLASPK